MRGVVLQGVANRARMPFMQKLVFQQVHMSALVDASTAAQLALSELAGLAVLQLAQGGFASLSADKSAMHGDSSERCRRTLAAGVACTAAGHIDNICRYEEPQVDQLHTTASLRAAAAQLLRCDL